MNAVELLKNDHSHVKELFANFEKAGDNADERKRSLCEQITNELQIHTQIEEEIFYPAMREAGAGAQTSDEENEEQVLEAYEEHNLAKVVINDLRGLSADDAHFNAKMKVLKDVIDHHVEEEEEQMFPRARQTLGTDRLEELGREMAERKRSLSAGGITGTIAKMVTKAFDSLSGGRETKKTAAKSSSAHRASTSNGSHNGATTHARARSKPRTDTKAHIAKAARRSKPSKASKTIKSTRSNAASAASRKSRSKSAAASHSRSH